MVFAILDVVLSQYVEEYVAQDDPVCVYDIFVESLDVGELGIVCNPNRVDNPEYDSEAMLKILVYSYSYGIRSSRKFRKGDLSQYIHHVADGRSKAGS